jgi:hypothetical protein
MSYRLNIINREWFPGVSELEFLMGEVDLDLDLVLADCTGVLRILHKFPDPPLTGSCIELVIESIYPIDYLVGILIR